MFGFSSIGHFFASIGRDVVKGVTAIEPIIQKSETGVEAITAAIPGLAPAVLIERAIYGVFGKVSQAVHDGQQLVVNGKSLLDPTEIAEIQSIIAAIKAIPLATPIAPVATATAATPTTAGAKA